MKEKKNARKMGTDSVEDQVRAIVIDQLTGVQNETDVTLSSDLVRDLGADSLDIVEIVMNVEEAFELEIASEKAYQLKTVGELCRYVEEHHVVKESVA